VGAHCLVLKTGRELKKDPSLKVLGERIRISRKAMMLSQEELAFRSEIDRTYMGGIERGERNLSFKKLSNIANVLGCDLGILTAGLPIK
jgi:transcriptional regulator with XRE-family HTH domain